jgi:tetratricopeptide (TPR) repeat protein
MGQAYKDLGIYDKANQLFEKSLSIDPNYVQAYHLHALAKFSAGDHKGSLVLFSKAVQLDPNHIESRYMKAVVEHGLV